MCSGGGGGSSSTVLVEKKEKEKFFYVPIKAALLQADWVCVYICESGETEGGLGGVGPVW